jgi:hypothetical protein
MLYIRKLFRLLGLIVAFLFVLSYGMGVYAQGEEPTPVATKPTATWSAETPVPTEPIVTGNPDTSVPAAPVPTEGGSITPTPDISAGETPAEPTICYGEIVDALPFGGLNGTQLQLGGTIRTFAVPSVTVPSVNVALSARIVETMENYGTIVDLSDLNLPNSDDTRAMVNTCLTAVVNSYPQYFYYGFTYSTVGYPDLMLSIHLNLNRSEDEARAQRTELMSVISAALKNVLPASAVMTQTEKALALHDYLVVHNRYNYGALYYPDMYPDAFNAYGALVKGSAVCQGIAIAYKALLQAAGVSTYVVTSDNLNHAWNLVETEYGWYHVDATWDDPQNYEYNGDYDWMGYGEHTCFMMTEAELNVNRYTSQPNDAIAQITSGTAPQTAAFSHPNSEFWKDAQGGMFYDAGYWYYNDGTLLANAENQLITIGNLKKTIYDSFFGSGTTIAENASFAAFDGGNLYYFDHAAHCIKRYNLKSTEIVDLLYYSAGEVVSELGIGPINLFAADNPEGSLVPKQRLLYVLHGGGMTSVLTHDVSAYFGDLNSDGRANENDALLICDYKISMALDSAQLALADVNRDGRIDLLDALEICR